ncbi:MAG: putative phage protein [Rickettsiaceae bacterium]|jgi:predicted phage terminase large subunit-like protein|nr:putative phage protein [Rickettsiaceae bacterium]
MMKNHPIFQTALQHNFANFIRKYFETINPGIEYKSNWHIDLIAEQLAEVQEGKIKRLMINMPPRALKSVCVSVAWPAWLLGHNPTLRIIVASYSQVLSIKHSLDCRAVMESSWYQEMFPATSLSEVHNTKSKFLTTQFGFRFAVSVGGSITGEGGDYLIIDDPHNPTHIHSKKQREKVNTWYEQTFATRLNDKSKGAIILVMQRLHEGDLAGHLLANSKRWKQLKLPAIAQEEYAYEVNGKQHFYVPGEVLHSGREELEELALIQEELGSHNFAAQYLQEPISNASSLLKKENISFFNEQVKFDYIVQSWDTAIKVSCQSDYTVCTTWGVQGNRYFLIDMLRAKYEYSELKRTIISQAAIYRPKFVIIEDKASGQSLIQDLAIETNIHIKKYKPVRDKVTRFAATIPYFESGWIVIAEGAAWLNVFLQELMAFPAGTNDDIIDSLSQFIDVIKTHKDNLPRIRNL